MEESFWRGGSELPPTPTLKGPLFRKPCLEHGLCVLTLGLGLWTKWTMGKGSRECGCLGKFGIWTPGKDGEGCGASVDRAGEL